MYETSARPELNVPPQAPAVRRALWEAPADSGTDQGVNPAKSLCGDLTGSGRDLCRSLQDG